MKREIWCTLGPSSLLAGVISRLEALEVTLFRLNLSHTTEAALPEMLTYLANCTRVPICLDTEGAQVRTGSLTHTKIVARTHATISIRRDPVPGDKNVFNLYPEGIVDFLRIGDVLRIDSEVLAQVVDITDDCAVMAVLSGGVIGQNKAVTILGREVAMLPLTQKDRRCLEIGKQMGIRHIALSFAHRASDVDAARALSHKDTLVISKIECQSGLNNLEEIAAASDALLIDRGDLSREVDIEKLPAIQKEIIRYCNRHEVKIYVATNLMESMVTAPSPTRAEVNDVFNTLVDGADGLVLAAETAVGAYPVNAANMVRKIIREYDETFAWPRAYRVGEPAPDASLVSHLIEPHGGQLVRREMDEGEHLADLKTLRVTGAALTDCGHIAAGTYSPLTGFMTSLELESVLATNRLPDGLPWTMPIVLQVAADDVSDISVGERVALADSAGRIRAALDVGEIYAVDGEDIAMKWFGTASPDHPGVRRLASGGERFVAGEVTLIRGSRSEWHRYDLTPIQARLAFAQKGWSRVVGFHLRTQPSRTGEYARLRALESVAGDGLFVSVAACTLEEDGSVSQRPVLRSYRLLAEGAVYPADQIVLAGLSVYPRHCAHREVLFAALCHKNMGCTHFLLDEAREGVRGALTDSEVRALWNEFDDVGIIPVFVGSDSCPETVDRQKAIA